MKTCPECNEKYADDAEKCPNCGWNGIEWVHLTTVGNDIEFEILAGLLETGDIPAISRSIGIDKYVGAPLGGLDVLVPGDKYDEALQLLNAQVDESLLEEEETEAAEEEATKDES